MTISDIKINLAKLAWAKYEPWYLKSKFRKKILNVSPLCSSYEIHL